MKKEITIQKQVNPIVKQVQTLVISSQEDMTKAVSTLSKLNKFADHIDEEKKKLTKPINEALKEIRSRYAPIEDVLSDAIETLKGKMTSYQDEATKAQHESEEDVADRVNRGILKVQNAFREMEGIPIVEEKIK